MNICNKCFQLTTTIHTDCIEIVLPPSNISFNCNLPIGSLIALLKHNNIEISNVKQTYNIKEPNETKQTTDPNETKETTEPIESKQTHKIKEFFEGINTKPDLKNYVLKNILNMPVHLRQEYYENIKKTCERIIPKATSRDVFYTMLRIPIMTKYGRNSPEHKESYIFKIKRDERDYLNNEKIKKVKLNNKTPTVYKINQILNTIGQGQVSSNKWGRYISLLLSCGARPAELLLNTFKIDGHTKGNVLVSNLSKKRNEKYFTVSRPIIGYSPVEFINQVKIMKELIGGTLTRPNLTSIQNHLKKYFLNKEVKPSTLRKLYANACYLLYGSGNLNIYISQLLGHSNKDIITSFNYSTVSVIE